MVFDRSGTIPYMSPEQAESQELTCATDVFSLGTVLYEMLTRTHPFRVASALNTLRRVADANPEPISTVAEEIPNDVAEFVLEMLSRSPEQRPSARQVADRLTTLSEGSQ
jgi:serine/threonine protein kinase